MTTPAEEWYDVLTRHQVGLHRVGSGIRRRSTEILDASEAVMRRMIADLSSATGLRTPAAARRARRVIDRVLAVRRRAWARVERQWLGELTEMSLAEPDFLARHLEAVSPVVIRARRPTRRVQRAIVSVRLADGRRLDQYLRDARDADLRAIRSRLLAGVSQANGVRALQSAIVGTRRTRGTSGVTATTRRNLDTETRTAVTHISGQSRAAFAVANPNVFRGERFVAVLDGRTTAICRGIDSRGLIYPVGEGPIPPMHRKCRSERHPVPDGASMARRQTLPATEQTLLQDYARQAGIDAVASRDSLPFGHKGRFDRFARTRLRTLMSTVPADVTYDQWLRRQSRAFQDSVLGPTKAKLFRAGLRLDRFTNRAGDELTLSELARTEADAFEAAGLSTDAA